MTTRRRISDLYISIAPALGALLASRFPKEAHLVPDIIHDCFLHVLSNKNILQTVEAMSDSIALRYFYKAARNFLISRLRQRSARIETIEHVAGIPADQKHLVVSWGRDEWSVLKENLFKVRAPYKEVLEMLLLDEQNALQISKRTGRSVNAVYQQIIAEWPS